MHACLLYSTLRYRGRKYLKNQNPSFWRKFQTSESRPLKHFFTYASTCQMSMLSFDKTPFDSSKPAVNHRKIYQTIDKNQSTEYYYFN